MVLSSVLAFGAAAFSGSLGVLALIRARRSLAIWAFFFGMVILAVESLFGALSLRGSTSEGFLIWQTRALFAEALIPCAWLCFSLTYSRGNHRDFVRKWRVLLLLSAVFPIVWMTVFHAALLSARSSAGTDIPGGVFFEGPAKVLNGTLLVAIALILSNLEKTFRSAVGTMQWRIKFMVLGVCVIFGTRIYTASQAVLFSGQDVYVVGIEAAALLIGCCMMTVAYLRRGLARVDVYPSRAVLQSSLTLVLVGSYLLVIGVLAKVVEELGGGIDFPIQALWVLVGMVLLAVLLLSSKLRQQLQLAVSHHFRRPRHDACKIWTKLTQVLGQRQEPKAVCEAASRFISETFDVLSVAIWLFDEQKRRLVLVSSTARGAPARNGSGQTILPAESNADALLMNSLPYDLERASDPWATGLREANVNQFENGGRRLGVPLYADERWIGVAVLADRVNGIPYSAEETDLLKCIGEQLAACLLRLELGEALLAAREFEAFQRITAFFVHDLKNAASGLSLLLKNLPRHFDDPAFRSDALRNIGNVVRRIDTLITRLSSLRDKAEPKLAECDLNILVKEAVGSLNGMLEVELIEELGCVPRIVADRDQLQSVVTNLLLNARDAVGRGGRIRVSTAQQNGSALLAVTDNGKGMSPAFLRDSLFRPFQSTKKRGLGIGMFQSRMIVEAHRGTIIADSEQGVGTTFKVALPIRPEAQ